MPISRFYVCSSVHNGKIYLFGGWDGSKSTSDVYAYDPVNDGWEKRHDLPVPRDSGSACSFNGKIYYMGGTNGGFTFSSQVFEYDPEKDKWTEKANMPNVRGGFSSNIVSSKIIAIGGHSPNGTLSVMDVYDPEQDKWLEPIKMTRKRSWFSSAVLDNKIYVIGGTSWWDGMLWKDIRDALNLVEEYTPDNSQFSVNSQDKLSSTWGSIKAIK